MKTHVIKRATTLPIHIQQLPIIGMTIELGPQKWLIKVSRFKRRTLLFFLDFIFSVYLFLDCRLSLLISIRKRRSLTDHNSFSFSFRLQTKVTVEVRIFKRHYGWILTRKKYWEVNLLPNIDELWQKLTLIMYSYFAPSPLSR